MGKERVPSVVEQLRSAIRADGRSLTQLAKDCGVGSDRLSRFMTGTRDLRFEAVAEICKALGLHLAPKKGKAKK
jgi:DNA-binding phage protein